MPIQNERQLQADWSDLDSLEAAAQEFEDGMKEEQRPRANTSQPATKMDIPVEDWWALQNGN